jgi:hypothetical protein
MEWLLGFPAIAILVVGLIGQAFEMRRLRFTIHRDDELASPNIFMHKKNFKWYGIIGLALLLWYLAERM